MIGYRPGPYIKYCWLFFTPATCIVSINKLIRLHQGVPKMTKADSGWGPLYSFTVTTRDSFLTSNTNTSLLVPPGYLCLFPHQIHSSKVQQWVRVPVVGLCHWLAACPRLHGLHPILDGVQDKHHPGDTQRGKRWPIKSSLWSFTQWHIQNFWQGWCKWGTDLCNIPLPLFIL